MLGPSRDNAVLCSGVAGLPLILPFERSHCGTFILRVPRSSDSQSPKLFNHHPISHHTSIVEDRTSSATAWRLILAGEVGWNPQRAAILGVSNPARLFEHISSCISGVPLLISLDKGCTYSTLVAHSRTTLLQPLWPGPLSSDRPLRDGDCVSSKHSRALVTVAGGTVALERISDLCPPFHVGRTFPTLPLHGFSCSSQSRASSRLARRPFRLQFSKAELLFAEGRLLRPELTTLRSHPTATPSIHI